MSDNLLLLIYVKEMIYLPAILPFFKIHVNQFLAQDDSPAANVILPTEYWRKLGSATPTEATQQARTHSLGWGWGAVLRVRGL